MDDKPAIRKGETELPESRIFGKFGEVSDNRFQGSETHREILVRTDMR